jgi:hypothetical protein
MQWKSSKDPKSANFATMMEGFAKRDYLDEKVTNEDDFFC